VGLHGVVGAKVVGSIVGWRGISSRRCGRSLAIGWGRCCCIWGLPIWWCGSGAAGWWVALRIGRHLGSLDEWSNWAPVRHEEALLRDWCFWLGDMPGIHGLAVAGILVLVHHFVFAKLLLR
jgi:hypothetical protein